MTALLYRKIAEQRVHEYASLIVPQGNMQVVDYLNCVASLGMGIDAFKWLVKVRRVLYASKYDGSFDYNVEPLFKVWLQPCERALACTARCEKHGYDLRNKAKFVSCLREAEAIIRHWEEAKTRAEEVSDLWGGSGQVALKDDEMSRQPQPSLTDFTDSSVSDAAPLGLSDAASHH